MYPCDIISCLLGDPLKYHDSVRVDGGEGIISAELLLLLFPKLNNSI